MTSEKYVSEKELNEKAVAPRVTMDAIEANIVSENYFSAHQGARMGMLDAAVESGDSAVIQDVLKIPEALRLTTYCVLTLKNGFTVTGQSACASPENYDEDIGRRVARGDAIRQIWPLMGYELRSRLVAQAAAATDNLGEALTRMTALTLGNPSAFRDQDASTILSHFEGTDHQEEGGETYATVPLSDEQVAEICYSVNKAWCEKNGDYSFSSWADAPDWQKASCIDGVRFHRANPDSTPEQSHRNWLAEKEKEGWVYGPLKDVQAKEHPCMVPYDQLPESQQFKDKLFIAVCHAADSKA